MTTGIYYVSPAGSDTKPGTSWTDAFATIERGLSALGVDSGVVEVAPGSYNAPAAGLVVHADQHLFCRGNAQLNAAAVTTQGTACIAIVGGRSSVAGFWIINLRSYTIGVRVTNSQTGSTESVLVERMLVSQSNATESIAFGIGDDTSGDVSEVMLRHCISGGNATTTHMQCGNGGTGNVQDITNIGGDSQINKYGIVIAGGSILSDGLNFQNSSGADIYCYANALGQISIRGSRSEGALRLLDHTRWGCQVYNGFVLEDIVALGLTNTDGQGVITLGGALRLKNISMFGMTCPQYVGMRLAGVIPDRDVVGRVEIDGLTSDHPYPVGGTPFARSGRVIEARGVRFSGDGAFQMRQNRSSERTVRRVLATTTPLTLDSRYAQEHVVGLEVDSGPVILTPGAIGQEATITYEQNGAGGKIYDWPDTCAFDGGKPANATGSRARQTGRFHWNGSYWEQSGPVITTVPPQRPFTPVVDNFSSGNRFWLEKPSTPNGHLWEHIPGGGSLGIVNGKCVCNCLGWVGDNNIDMLANGAGLFAATAAGAVIETDGNGIDVTVSSTFTWYSAEGLIVRYRDDQSFWVIYLASNGLGYAQGWSHGKPAVQGPRAYFAPGLQVGSQHTLAVKCTATGFIVTLDNNASTAINVSDIDRWLPNTKHGIVTTDTRVQFSAFSVA